MKRKISLIIIGILLIACTMVVSYKFLKGKDTIKEPLDDNFELIKYTLESNDNIDLKQYTKAYAKTEYLDDIDRNYIKLVDTKETDDEFVRKYKLTMNNREHEVIEKYDFTDEEVHFILTIDGKVLDDRKSQYEIFDIENKDDITKDDGNVLFKPEILIVFKGDDDKEYLLYEQLQPTPAYYFSYAKVYNDYFDEIELNFINDVENYNYIIYGWMGYEANLLQYSNNIGLFRASKDFEQRNYFGIVNNKIKFFHVVFNQQSCSKATTTYEYELKIKNSKIEPILLNTYDTYNVSEQMC